MKIAKLLVLSVLWLTASSAFAAVPENVHQKPTIAATQGFEASETTDTYFYLYNVGAEAFFTEGNAWGTQASIGSSGLKVAFTPDGDAYLFNDYSLAKGSWKLCFFDSETAMYVDLGSQANYRWGVEKGNGTFRLYAASEADGNPGWGEDKPAYREGQYMGYDKANTGTTLTPYLTAEEGHCVDWALVTEATYDAYKALNDVYLAAEALKPVLEEAEGLGANIAAQLAIYTNATSTAEALNGATTELKALIEARKPLKSTLDDAKAAGFTETAEFDTVFNNGDATVADLKAALESLNAALVEWGKTHATVANPADMTSKIVNPNFDNASYSGWSGDAPNMTGSGSHGPANVPEKWNATFNTYQDITELPAGVYALSAQTMWRGSWNDMKNNVGPASLLYAIAGEKEYSVPFNFAYAPMNTVSMAGNTEWGVGASEQSYTDESVDPAVTYYIPNDPSCFRVYAEKGLYDTKVLFGISEGETLRIGTKNPSMKGDADNWSCWDTFKLTYYGTGSDAAELYLNETIKNYSEMTIEEGTIYTESYLTEYNEVLKQEISVSSFEEVATALGGIEAAKQAIETNIALWKKWQEKVVKAGEYVADPDYEDEQLAEYVGPLGDYYDMEQEEILAAKSLSNEELQAEIDKIDEMITALLDASKTMLKDGDDVTRFLTNPGFDDDANIDSGQAEGWTITRGDSNGNVTRGPLGQGNKDLMLNALGYMNYCFEAWHCHNFDIWQEVKDAPVGVYEISCQGYVRCEANGYTRGDLTGLPEIPIYLYMNSATSQFPDVYSEDLPEGKEFTTVESWTVETINDKPYPNSMGGAAQCFGWDMYKKHAYGLVAKKGDVLRIGVKGDMTTDWWCIWDNFKLTYRAFNPDVVKPALEEALLTVDTSKPMGKEVYELAEKVTGDAQTAIANGDGSEMFAALTAIYEATDSIRSSVRKFESLNDANADLANALAAAVVASIRAEGDALYGKVQDGLDNHTLETSEVDGLLEEIAVMINRLGTPADMDQASDANPVECTTMIINPAYVDGNDKGWTGGAAINASATDAEKFNTNYNYFQVINGLPEGTYQVTVQGFFRSGSAADDYKKFKENPEVDNNAFLYAVGAANDTCSVPMMRLASQAVPSEDLLDSWVWASEEEKLAVPNSMQTAGDQFQTPNDATGKNYYADNRVTVKVGADGKLTIGLKKDVKLTDDWTIWTNWQLFYFGNNSALTPDSDASHINNLNGDPVKVEFFNLAGQQLKAVNGVAIKKVTTADGNVSTQTVIVK